MTQLFSKRETKNLLAINNKILCFIYKLNTILTKLKKGKTQIYLSNFRYITTIELPEFVPPPIGSHTFKDFNILYHVRTLPEPVSNEDEEEEEDYDIIDENKVYDRRIV